MAGVTKRARSSAKEERFVFAKIEVAGHSKIVREGPPDEIDGVFEALERYLVGKVESAGGETWSWTRDGGLAAFHVEGEAAPRVRQVVGLAQDIMAGLGAFNRGKWPLPRVPIRLRIALHLGEAKQKRERGRAHDTAANCYVSHVEAEVTPTGGITVSDEVYRELTPEVRARFFGPIGSEGQEIYSTRRIRLWADKPPEGDREGAGTKLPDADEGHMVDVELLDADGPEAETDLSPHQLLAGAARLAGQISKRYPRTAPDLWVGVNQIGTLVASYLSGVLSPAPQLVASVLTDPISRKVAKHNLPPQRGVRTIIVVDKEIKTGESICDVFRLLERRYGDEVSLYLAVLAACKVRDIPKKSLGELRRSIGEPAPIPRFVAYLTRGRVRAPGGLR